jgi:hypothetical protein
VIFTACPNPNCARREFSSRSARDNHVYRYKQKGYCPNENRKSHTSRAEPVKINEKITHPFSDEWDCAVCLHRFSSLESAEDHYKTRHIDKVPYETEPNQENIPVKQALNIQDLLNEMAKQRAEELMRARFDGIVKQNLVVFEPEPSPQREPESQAPIVESDSPNNEIDSKPQSPVIINAIKNLFRGKGKMQVSKEPQPELNQVFMANRGIGVDGVSISFNPKPNYCKNDKVWLYDIEVQQHVELGHTVVRQG